MGFENDYAVFLKSILAEKVQVAEELISFSDNRRSFILGAVHDLGELRVSTFLNLFKSIGLKKELEKIVHEYKEQPSNKEYSLKLESRKIVRVHEQNKQMNEKYHLSGGSFKNQKSSAVSA